MPHPDERIRGPPRAIPFLRPVGESLQGIPRFLDSSIPPLSLLSLLLLFLPLFPLFPFSLSSSSSFSSRSLQCYPALLTLVRGASTVAPGVPGHFDDRTGRLPTWAPGRLGRSSELGVREAKGRPGRYQGTFDVRSRRVDGRPGRTWALSRSAPPAGSLPGHPDVWGDRQSSAFGKQKGAPGATKAR